MTSLDAASMLFRYMCLRDAAWCMHCEEEGGCSFYIFTVYAPSGLFLYYPAPPPLFSDIINQISPFTLSREYIAAVVLRIVYYHGIENLANRAEVKVTLGGARNRNRIFRQKMFRRSCNNHTWAISWCLRYLIVDTSESSRFAPKRLCKWAALQMPTDKNILIIYKRTIPLPWVPVYRRFRSVNQESDLVSFS
jgi:hypothetical protein